MRQMHEGRVGGAEYRPHFEDALRQADHFAGFFAAALQGRARLKPMPTATRQKSALEIRRRETEPAATGQDAQTLSLIHVKNPFCGGVIFSPRPFIAQKWATGKRVVC
jgi:hypothetical protein